MKRNKFSLSHYRLQSLDMGYLVPCSLVEVLPGDTVQAATSALVRVSPLVSPVMHAVDVRLHWWYVPHRIIWDDFEDFITGGPDGMDDSDFPTRTLGSSILVGSLGDYLGVPPAVGGTYNPVLVVSDLPFRAYAKIWNEWYRDQDLQSELVVRTSSGAGNQTNNALQRVSWEKDYFTSARPWEQKGPTITIPLGQSAEVRSTGQSIDVRNNGFTRTLVGSQTGNSVNYSGASITSINNLDFGADGALVDSLYTDLSGASAVTVNLLREALALQRYEEARARYGSRYTEYLRYLGVRSSDARLQRPEYLGGGSDTLQFSEVLQTAPGDDPSVGSMYGHGIGLSRSRRWRRFFEEHGYVMCLMSVRPKTVYANSLKRTWNRRIKEDFWQKELEHIGQQEIQNQEIFPHRTDADNRTAVFGFQDRYDEYRRHESEVAGEFRTSVLDSWHMARSFTSVPVLNGDFVTANPTNRIFQSSTNQTLYAYVKHSIQARRMLSKRGSSFTF